jgi:hypothetical protein
LAGILVQQWALLVDYNGAGENVDFWAGGVRLRHTQRGDAPADPDRD